jgi:hypothetical protein
LVCWRQLFAFSDDPVKPTETYSYSPATEYKSSTSPKLYDDKVDSIECNLFTWNKPNHAARAVIVVFLSIMPNSLKSSETPIAAGAS